MINRRRITVVIKRLPLKVFCVARLRKERTNIMSERKRGHWSLAEIATIKATTAATEIAGPVL